LVFAEARHGQHKALDLSTLGFINLSELHTVALWRAVRLMIDQ